MEVTIIYTPLITQGKWDWIELINGLVVKIPWDSKGYLTKTSSYCLKYFLSRIACDSSALNLSLQLQTVLTLSRPQKLQMKAWLMVQHLSSQPRR